MRILLLVLFFLCSFSESKAQPEYLDSSFNGTGLREIFTQSLPSAYRSGYVKSLILQSDGKMLALISLDSAALIIRLLPNGSKDPAIAQIKSAIRKVSDIRPLAKVERI